MLTWSLAVQTHASVARAIANPRYDTLIQTYRFLYGKLSPPPPPRNTMRHTTQQLLCGVNISITSLLPVTAASLHFK